MSWRDAIRRWLAGPCFAALAIGCCPAQPAHCDVPQPDDDGEPTTDEAVRDACHRAGVRLAALQCPEARPDFDDFCHHLMADDIPLKPTCLSKITKCSDVDLVCR